MKRLLLAAALLGGCNATPPAPPTALHVLTGLPLFLGEGSIAEIVQGKTSPPPIIPHLVQRFAVSPLDVARPHALATAKMLLAIQPPALTPEELVALDDWVRAGGHALILADPDLRWPSALPKGDPRRPPVATLLTPLFEHWGLRLVADRADAPPRMLAWRRLQIGLDGAGHWQATRPSCEVLRPEIARCALGQGVVVVISDADWLLQPRDSAVLRLLDALLQDLNVQTLPVTREYGRPKQGEEQTDSP